MVERLIRPPQPAPGGRTIWVSTDPTVTPGDGSSQSKVLRDPVAARKLIPNRTGSVLALHRGDTFGSLGSDQVGAWDKSGASAAAPLTICSWGPASKPNPVIRPPANQHGLLMYQEPVSQLRILGVDFKGTQGTMSDGIIAAGDVTELLLENCDVSLFHNAVTATHTGTRKRWTLRQCVLADCFDPGNPYDGNGAFFSRTHDFTLERCLVMRNGVRPDGTVTHCHGIYNLAADHSTSGFIARDCIFALNGNTGLSARTGGLVEDCLFIANAIAWNFGASNTPIQGGIDFVARRVVTTESKGIGWAGWMRNVNSGLIEDAIMANAGPGTQGRSYLIGGNNQPDAGWPNGPVANLTTRRLIIHKHGQGPEIGEAVGMAKNIRFEDCEGPAIVGAAQHGSEIKYFGAKFGDPQAGYPDPNRTVARYDQEVLGGPGSIAHFVTEARKSPGAARFSAKAVNAWIAQGFGKTWAQ